MVGPPRPWRQRQQPGQREAVDCEHAFWGDDIDAYARLRPTETAVVVLEPQA
jgi:hypothetical protein